MGVPMVTARDRFAIIRKLDCQRQQQQKMNQQYCLFLLFVLVAM
jgi:hypothetical protein